MASTTPISVLAAHARAVAAAFNVRMIEDPACTFEKAMAMHLYVGEMLLAEAVHVPPITCEKSFAAAMHEIGHCVAALGSLRNTEEKRSNWNLKLEEERAAWEWARHFSKPYWSDRMESEALLAYETYRQGYIEYQRKETMKRFTPKRRQSISDFMKGIK